MDETQIIYEMQLGSLSLVAGCMRLDLPRAYAGL